MFDKVSWPGEEVVLRNWQEEMALILSGVRLNRPKVWEKIEVEAGDCVYIVSDRVFVELG